MIRAAVFAVGLVQFAAAALAADNTFVQCLELRKLVEVARAGREGPGLQPFGAIRLMSQPYLGATCVSQGEKGKINLTCELKDADAASLQSKLRSWDGGASTCLAGWERTAWENDTRFISPEGAVEVRFTRAANEPVLKATVRHEACLSMNEMFNLAMKGQHSSAQPKFTKQPRALPVRYYDARACTGRANDTNDGYSVSCAFDAPDAIAGHRKFKGAQQIAEFCLKKWTSAPVPGGIAFRTTEKTDVFSLVKRDEQNFDMTMSLNRDPANAPYQSAFARGAEPPPLVPANASCEPFRDMEASVRNGTWVGADGRATSIPGPLKVQYFGAVCSANKHSISETVVETSVECMFPESSAAAARRAAEEIAAKVKTCRADWRGTTFTDSWYFNSAEGIQFNARAEGGKPAAFTMSRRGPKAAMPPAPVSTTPAIPQAPAQSSCTPYNDLFLMAKIGSEGGTSAPFTATPRTLAHAYLGAQSCTGAKAGTGHTITCTTAAGDAASAKLALEAQDKGMAACHGDWFRVQPKADHVFFMLPTDRASLRIEKSDAASVRTTMTYDSCKPLDDMMFSVGVGQWFGTDGKQTGAATPLRLKYFGGTCNAQPARGIRSNTIACVFPDLGGAPAKRTAADIVQTVKACYPDWKSTDLSDSWIFETAGGFQMIVEAREGRPPAFMMQKKPK